MAILLRIKFGKKFQIVFSNFEMRVDGNDIQTAARYNIPVIFVVLNNAAHGAVYLENNNVDSFSDKLAKLPHHNWAKYTESLGVKGFTVEKIAQLIPTVEQALSLRQACLIDVHCGVDYKPPNHLYRRETENFTAEMLNSE